MGPIQADAHSCIYSAAFVLFSVVALRFQEIFVEFKLDIPPFTRAVIRSAEFIYIDFGWIFTVPILAIVPSMIGSGFPSKRNRISNIVLVLFVVTTGVVVIALFSPMIPIGGGLSGPSK